MLSTNRLQACCLLLAISLTLANGALYDRKRGLQTYNLGAEQVDAYLKAHDANTIIGKHKQREELKQHPDVQSFLAWRDKHKAGDPEAGVAFAGKIPHDYLPLMTSRTGQRQGPPDSEL